MQKSGVYQILNKVNGKRYIGSAKNIGYRLKRHIGNLENCRHENYKLQNSYNKYGKESFIFESLFFCREEDLIKAEQFYIDSYNFEYLYNIRPLAGNNLGLKYTEEQCAKIAKSHEKRRSLPKGIRVVDGKFKTSIFVDKVNYYVGTYETLEEAVKLRDDAYEECGIIKDSDLIKYNLKKYKRSKKDPYKETGYTFNKGNYISILYGNKKSVYIGTFKSKEKALEEYLKAKKRLDSGEPMDDIRKSYLVRYTRELPKNVVKSGNKYRVHFNINKKYYHIGCFQSLEESISVKHEVENRINNNLDFQDIINKYKFKKIGELQMS